MNSLQFWTPDGFEISSWKYGIDTRKNKIYNQSGSDTSGLCTYTYNELGFRGDSIEKKGFKVMSLGCSNTEGVGVNDSDTWPAQFTHHIPNGVNMNFGTGGRSNDFIVRCLLTYYDLIKPDLVLIMYTGSSRRDFYTKDGGVEPFMPTGAWGYFSETEDGVLTHDNLTKLQNNNEDFVNWYKNHLLIKYFLESKKSNWMWNGVFDIPDEYNEVNRFDGNFKKFIDYGVDGIHPGPLTNKDYSSCLYYHLYKNFREYLPKESETPRKIIL
jgi:hypothetical protein